MALSIVSSSTYNSAGTALNTHSVPMPSSLAAGNLLLLFYTQHGTDGTTLPSGWTTLFSNTTSSPSDPHYILAKISGGTEGNQNFIIGGGKAQRATAVVYNISGNRNGVTSSEIAVSSEVAETSILTPNPPSLTPSWGSAENLWIAVSFVNDGSFTFVSYPTNYTLGQNAQQNGSGTGNAILIAARLLTASSEDPGVFTISGSTRNFGSLTIAVCPEASTSASFAITEATDTAALTLTAKHAAAVSATEPSDVAAVTLTAKHTLSVGATEGADVASATLTAAHGLSVSATEAADVPSISLSANHALSLSTTEPSDTAAASIDFFDGFIVAATESSDTASAAVSVIQSLTMAVTEPSDVVQILMGETFVLTATEAPDTAAVSLSATHDLTLSSTEGADVLAASLEAYHSLSLSVTDAIDVAAGTMTAAHGITADIFEGSDVAAGTLTAKHTISIGATEARDTANVNIGDIPVFSMNVTEPPDTLYLDFQFVYNRDPDVRNIYSRPGGKERFWRAVRATERKNPDAI